MKKLLFLGACLVALSSTPVLAQTVDPQVIVVEVYYSGVRTGHIDITRGAGQVEKTTFSGKESGEALQAAIAKLYQQGYSLKSTFNPLGGTDVSISTLVFVKESR